MEDDSEEEQSQKDDGVDDMKFNEEINDPVDEHDEEHGDFLDKNQEIQEKLSPRSIANKAEAMKALLIPKNYAFVPENWCKKIRPAGAPAQRSE